MVLSVSGSSRWLEEVEPTYTSPPPLPTTKDTFTLVRLAFARLASAQLGLHWLCNHETVGGVNTVKQENIRYNYFCYFSRHGVAALE